MAVKYIIARKPGTVLFTEPGLWLSVTAEITDVLGALVLGGIVCTELVGGIGWVGEVYLQSTDTYIIRWTATDSGGAKTYTDSLQAILTTHATTIRVWDETLNVRHAGVRVMILEDVGVGYELVAETTTDSEGECTLALTDGDFIIALQKSGYCFSSNCQPLPVNTADEELPVMLDTLLVAVPATGYVAPKSLVTMTGSLVNGQGLPIRFRKVLITVLGPAGYTSGESFVVGEDRHIVETDSNGAFSVSLIAGIPVEVAVANTRIIRRFTVPAVDFDFMDYLGDVDDVFDVQQVEYPNARRIS